MNENNMRCKRCILDSKTPGIIINPKSGLCQFCEQAPTEISAEGVHQILSTNRGEREYDVIFALSGGKDSCYTLSRLKELYPDLRILAVQFDNGFISDIAVENAKQFCCMTGATYLSLTTNPTLLYTTFRRAAESKNVYPIISRIRASDICNTCIGIIKQKLIELALINQVPLVIFAFSPGQTTSPFIRLSPSSVLWFRTIFQRELEAMGVPENDELLINIDLIDTLRKRELIIVHPLLAWDYDKQRVEQTCIDRGWKRPDLQDKHSTNCRLNAFANDNHIRKYGIHPYAFELAMLVREGRLSREDAQKSVKAPSSPDLIRYAKTKIHMSQNTEIRNDDVR